MNVMPSELALMTISCCSYCSCDTFLLLVAEKHVLPNASRAYFERRIRKMSRTYDTGRVHFCCVQHDTCRSATIDESLTQRGIDALTTLSRHTRISDLYNRGRNYTQAQSAKRTDVLSRASVNLHADKKKVPLS